MARSVRQPGRLTAILCLWAVPLVPGFAQTLPRPTGPYAIGTRVVHWADSSRRDKEFPGGRPITVQVWYPGSSGTSDFARYLIEPHLLPVLLDQGYYGQDTTTLSAWPTLATHSVFDGAVAKGRFPLVSLSVGLGVMRANYTSMAEELASHGMVVAAVEGPLAGLMEIPDGRVVFDSAGITNDAAGHRTAVGNWSRDIRFTLDRLSHSTTAGSLGAVAAIIDWHRVGAIGHSSGGLVALATCVDDGRVTACVDMDGGFATPEHEPLADFVPHGVQVPALLFRSQPIYSDSDLAKRGLTRAQWEARNAGGKAAMDSLVARSPQLRVMSVAGTGHFNFSDGPFVMPTTITRFGGKIIEPLRGWMVITTVLREYLTAIWGHQAQRFPGDLTTRFPELQVSR